MRPGRYDNPELIDRLAREYVLGSLHGRARRRFERELAASVTARRCVSAWEARLTPLARTVAPETPPPAVWAGIERRLGLADRKPDRRLGFWRSLAAACAVVAIVLGGLYLNDAPEVSSADYVAVIADDTTGPVWLLQAFIDVRAIEVDNLNPFPEPANSSYELWMLPDDNTAPVSLGLIAGMADTELALTEAGIATLAGTSTLAVSVEPAGGSPTGAPTGPVILTAALLQT